jgi:hypothetical protein
MADWAGVCGVADDSGDSDHEVHDPEGFTAGQSISDTVKRKPKKMADIQVEGVVEDYIIAPTKNGSYRHGVVVAGSQYSAFADDQTPRANVGDTVTFPAVQKGQYFNIAGKVQVTKRATGHQQGAKQQYAKNENKREASIFRQNAMTQANALLSTAVAAGIKPDYFDVDMFAKEVIRLADTYFFPYAQDGTKPE